MLGPWVWPGGAVFATGVSLATLFPDAPWLGDGAFAYIWVVLAAGGLLALRFRRSRVMAVLALIGLLATVPSLERVLDAPGPWEAVGVFAVMTIMSATLVRDRSVLSPIGLIHLLGVLFFGWVSMATAELSPESWAWLDAVGTGRWGPDVAPMLLPVGILALVVAAVQAVRRENPVDRGLLWAGVALFFAAGALPGTAAAYTHLLAAGLILTLSLVETSHRLAYRDDLTGLPTRRALGQTFDDLGSTYAIAMLDVDHFKKFNDRHGHDVGDQVLRMVAGRLARVKGGGRPFRYGGEEFTIVFPGRSLDEALPYIEALRSSIEEGRFAVRRPGRPRQKPKAAPSGRGSKKEPRELSVTVSVGVAERTEARPDPDAVIKAADQALYRAKKAGRNRVAK